MININFMRLIRIRLKEDTWCIEVIVGYDHLYLYFLEYIKYLIIKLSRK